MGKSSFAVLIAIYIFLFVLNSLSPMAFGDDYLYSFIWQGDAMNTPLPENAMRLSSWHDLCMSQISHYFTWGGRTVAHTLAQFFLWTGKNTFNIFNAFVGVLLVVEICWYINKGKVTCHFEPKTLCWIFFVLWAFTPGFSPVFFWLTGACNYLWTGVFFLGFLIPYVNSYYSTKLGELETKKFYSVFMFFYGIIAGWTNENSVCWIILALMVYLYWCRKKYDVPYWMYCGLVGLIIGYALLLLAPGNILRLQAEQNGSAWLNAETLKKQLYTLFSVLLFQFFLWYFCIRSLLGMRKQEISKAIKKELLLVKVLCVISFGMSAIMVFSPGFPPRSGFPGTVQLIIAAGILLRLQNDYNLKLIQSGAQKFLFCVGCIYFVMTSSATLHNFYNTHEEMERFLTHINNVAEEYKDDILEVNHLNKASELETHLSGFHILGYELSDNEKEWVNVAFSRYYGIKGIRMVKEDDVGKKNSTKKHSVSTAESQSH